MWLARVSLEQEELVCFRNNALAVVSLRMMRTFHQPRTLTTERLTPMLVRSISLCPLMTRHQWPEGGGDGSRANRRGGTGSLATAKIDSIGISSGFAVVRMHVPLQVFFHQEHWQAERAARKAVDSAKASRQQALAEVLEILEDVMGSPCFAPNVDLTNTFGDSAGKGVTALLQLDKLLQIAGAPSLAMLAGFETSGFMSSGGGAMMPSTRSFAYMANNAEDTRSVRSQTSRSILKHFQEKVVN